MCEPRDERVHEVELSLRRGVWSAVADAVAAPREERADEILDPVDDCLVSRKADISGDALGVDRAAHVPDQAVQQGGHVGFGHGRRADGVAEQDIPQTLNEAVADRAAAHKLADGAREAADIEEQLPCVRERIAPRLQSRYREFGL